MGYDASRGRLVFTDRANHRLVFTDDSGAFVAETPLGEGGLAAPCNVDVSGDFAITASLGNTDGMQVRSNPCWLAVGLHSLLAVSSFEKLFAAAAFPPTGKLSRPRGLTRVAR